MNDVIREGIHTVLSVLMHAYYVHMWEATYVSFKMQSGFIVKCDWGLKKGTQSSKKPNGGRGHLPPCSLSGYAMGHLTSVTVQLA